MFILVLFDKLQFTHTIRYRAIFIFTLFPLLLYNLL